MESSYDMDIKMVLDEVVQDCQIDSKDVKLLGRFLASEKNIDELSDALRNSKNFEQFATVLKPSFKNLINSPNFDITNKENIVIIQFFAKYYNGENIVVDGVSSKNMKKLYMDIVFGNNSLDSNSFTSSGELEMFKSWLKMNDSISLQVVSREEFESKKPNIKNQNNKNQGDPNKPQGYDLYVPSDLKSLELPLIIKSINEISYGDSLPAGSSFKSFETKLEATIQYLQLLERDCSTDPEIKQKHTELLKKIQIIKKQYYPIDSVNSTQQVDLNSRIDLYFNNITNNSIEKNDIETKLLLVEKILSQDLQKYMELAVFERGTQTLFDHLTTPTKERHSYLLDTDERKKQGVDDVEGSVSSKLESMGTVQNKLKDHIGIEEYKIKLKQLDANDIKSKIVLEKEICNKILENICMYPWTDMQNSTNSQPSKMLETQKMVCLGKSIIAGGFLQDLGISYEALNVWGHSALMVKLSDGKEYYFDPTNATQISSFSNLESVKGGKYEKGNIVLKNQFMGGQDIYFGINGTFTDNDGKVHFSRADGEFGLMGSLYNNKGTEDDISVNDKILFFERAIKLNPNEINAYLNLMKLYIKIGNYEESEKLGNIAYNLDSGHKDLKIILADVYSNLAEINYKKGDLNSALKFAEKSIKLTETITPYNVIGKIYLKNGDNSKAIDCFMKGLDIGVSLFKGEIISKVDSIELIKNNLIEMSNRCPDDLKFKIFLKLGKVYRDFNELDKSIVYFKEIENLDSKDKWNGPYYIGVIELKKGNYEQCILKYNEAIDMLVGNPAKQQKVIKELKYILNEIIEKSPDSLVNVKDIFAKYS